MTVPNWSASGTYFETCNCNVVCPCYFFSDPTYEECAVLSAWHVEKGKFGEIPLDGLNAVLAARRDRTAKWSDEGSGCLLYLDQNASQSQRDALTQIFTGRVGGAPPLLSRVASGLLAVKGVGIEFRAQGKNRSLQIPDVVQAEIESLTGQGGSDVTIQSIPNFMVAGQTVIIAQSKRVSYRDHGFKWEFSGRNGMHAPFAYKGP